MELTKRDEHPLLKSVETQIEAWRTEQVRSIQLRPEFAAYALVLAACAQIGSHSEKGTAYQFNLVSRVASPLLKNENSFHTASADRADIGRGVERPLLRG